MAESKNPPFRLSLTGTPMLAERCVLLVDDQPSFKFTLATALRDAGAEVRFASDANQVIFRCNTAIETSRPFDLVIVRLASEHDGSMNLCRLLREHHYRGPILTVGQNAQRGDALDAGADALVDSTDVDQLLDAAVNLLQKSTPASEDVIDLPEDFQPVVSDLASFPQMHQMLACFVDQLPKRLNEMLDAARLHDLQQLEKMIGDLKRSAGSHGFVAISREAAETERQLHVTDSQSTASEELCRVLDKLNDLCRRAVAHGDANPDLPPSA